MAYNGPRLLVILWAIFGQFIGYNWKNILYICQKLWDILGKYYDICKVKIMIYTMGYSLRKVWDIFDKK